MERSFRKRLVIGQASILLVLATAVTTAILALRSTDQHIAQTAQIHERLALLGQLRTDVRELARSARRHVLTRDPQERQRMLAIETRVDKDRERLRDGTAREDARKLERELDEYVSAVIRAMSEGSGDPAPALARFEDELARVRSTTGLAFDELVDRERSGLHPSGSSRQLVHGAQWALLIAGILGALVAIGGTVSVTRLFARHRERTRRAEVEAERVAAAHKELLAASDELRVPLEGIIARCAQLRATKLHDQIEQRELETIEASARHVTRLLGELLDVTAIETGRVALGRRSCDAASLVDRAIDHHREAALDRGIRLRSEAQRETSVCADPERAGHVLMALLGEAIAMARVGAEIVVSTVSSHHGVRFNIVDDASPTLPEPRGRLYQPAAVAPSSNLDLLLCKRVIEAHGGRMGTEVAATGRTYWFTLPAEPTVLR